MTTARHLVVTAAESMDTDALAETLRASFTVRTAYSADSLQESLSEDVDVVLVDPDVPGTTVDDLVAEIMERELACEVGVLTDSDVEYEHATVVDPAASADELRRAVRELGDRAIYCRKLDTLYELARERATLRAREADSEEIADVEERFERHREEMRAVRDRLDADVAIEIALGKRL